MVDEMGEEKGEQQASEATHPEQKMLGQLRGFDLFFVHESKDTLSARFQVDGFLEEVGDAFFKHDYFVPYSGF
jgi:hypothetical protein